MAEEIKVTHSEVEITYDEHADVWRFTLRGRERKSATLAKAREAIDAVPTPTEKTFTPTKCYFWVDNRWCKATVTSLAESPGLSQFVWVSCEGRRSKELASRCFEVTPENEALMAGKDKLTAQIRALEEERSVMHRAMTTVNIEGK